MLGNREASRSRNLEGSVRAERIDDKRAAVQPVDATDQAGQIRFLVERQDYDRNLRVRHFALVGMARPTL